MAGAKSGGGGGGIVASVASFVTVSAVLVALIALSIASGNRPPDVPTVEAIEQAGGVAVKLPDGRIAEVFEAGDKNGRPILLIHGMSTTGSMYNSGWLNDLFAELGFRIIAPSLPGHGLSTIMHNRTTGEWVKDVEHILAAFNLSNEKFFVAGMSFGAQHAAAVGAAFPDRTLGVGIFLPQAPREETEDHQNAGAIFRVLKRLSELDAVRSIMAWVFVDVWGPHMLYTLLPNSFSEARDAYHLADPGPRYSKLFAENKRAYYYSGPRGWAEVAKTVAMGYQFDWRGGLSKASNVLIVCGMRDEMAPNDNCEYLHSNLVEAGCKDGLGGCFNYPVNQTHHWNTDVYHEVFGKLLEGAPLPTSSPPPVVE